MDSRKTTVWWLSYPPSGKRIKLRIADGQLNAADSDNIDAQNAICTRYKQAAELPRSVRVQWPVLRANFVPSTDTLDSKEARKQLNKRIRKACY